MAASRAHQHAVSERRRDLARLRRQGVRYDDERVLALGYASPDAARRDMNRALTKARDEEALEVGAYRQMENERLDALLEAAWPQATTRQPVVNKEGEVVAMAVDMRAVDTVLRLMDRRAKLNGLDAPARTEVSGPDGSAISFSSGEATELLTLIGISDQENADVPAVDHDDPEEDASGDENDDDDSDT